MDKALQSDGQKNPSSATHLQADLQQIELAEPHFHNLEIGIALNLLRRAQQSLARFILRGSQATSDGSQEDGADITPQ